MTNPLLRSVCLLLVLSSNTLICARPQEEVSVTVVLCEDEGSQCEAWGKIPTLCDKPQIRASCPKTCDACAEKIAKQDKEAEAPVESADVVENVPCTDMLPNCVSLQAAGMCTTVNIQKRFCEMDSR